MTGVKKNSRGGKVSIMKEIKKRKEPTKVLTDKKKTSRSFNKRKDTLLEKVQDLYTATSAEVTITIRAPSGALYEYSSPNFKKVPSMEPSMPASSSASSSPASTTPASSSIDSTPILSSASYSSSQSSSSAFSSLSSSMNATATTEISTQTTESTLVGDSADKSCCRICGESLSERKLWVECEVKYCCFWRHAWCMGVTAYRKNAIKTLNFIVLNI